MYTHAHLRYAEAMAHWGDADALFLALRQVNPIGLRDVVPPRAPAPGATATRRAPTRCFADRYEAAARYDDAEGRRDCRSKAAGASTRAAPGIATQLIRGARARAAPVALAPHASTRCCRASLDGLRATLEVAGVPLEVVYAIGERGHGPTALALNGAPLAFEREANPYRAGGAIVAMDVLRARLAAGGNTLS